MSDLLHVCRRRARSRARVRAAAVARRHTGVRPSRAPQQRRRGADAEPVLECMDRTPPVGVRDRRIRGRRRGEDAIERDLGRDCLAGDAARRTWPSSRTPPRDSSGAQFVRFRSGRRDRHGARPTTPPTRSSTSPGATTRRRDRPRRELPEGGDRPGLVRAILARPRPSVRLVSVSWVPTHGGLRAGRRGRRRGLRELRRSVSRRRVPGRGPDADRRRAIALRLPVHDGAQVPARAARHRLPVRVGPRARPGRSSVVRRHAWRTLDDARPIRRRATARRYEDWEFPYALVARHGGGRALCPGRRYRSHSGGRGDSRPTCASGCRPSLACASSTAVPSAVPSSQWRSTADTGPEVVAAAEGPAGSTRRRRCVSTECA